MAELQHSQIRSKLLETVVPYIDGTDIQNHDLVQREDHLLSRAVGVTALRIVSGAELSVATNSLVDGGLDNGVDFIHYEQQTRTLFLVQSKWSKSHSSSIESSNVQKFLKGVQDLVSLKKERFNTKVKARWPTIDDALTRLASVRLIIAYPGSSRISKDIQG